MREIESTTGVRTFRRLGVAVATAVALCSPWPAPAAGAAYTREALACYQAAARAAPGYPALCRQAAEDGDTHAMYLLGRASTDTARALEWLERAAAGNHPRAAAALAEVYRQRGEDERADELERRAARAGYGPSRIRIAERLRAAVDDPDSVARARELFLAAAAAGYPRAQYAAAVMLAAGEGGPVDEAQARSWLFEAASAGYLPAQYDYAMTLLERDRAEAKQWLRKAARRGHAQATYILAALNANDGRTRDDHRSALYWAHLAVRAGHRQAPALLQQIVSGRTAIAIEPPRIGTLGEVQQALAELGYDPGPADGVMGSRTREALIAFQRAAGLAPNGEVDEALTARLARSLAASRQ